MKLFTDLKESTRSREKTDLLISYVLVLTLMADGFETHLSDIAVDLKMIVPDVKYHYQELGYKSRGTQNNLKISLFVPLIFLTMNETIQRRQSSYKKAFRCLLGKLQSRFKLIYDGS